MPQTLSVQQVAARLAAGEPVLLLDVRSPEEHGYARIAGSTLIPLGELTSRVAEIDLPAGSTAVVYCHHGVRSLTGAALLERAGIAPVCSMSGGIDAWSLFVDPSVPRY